LLLRAPTVLTSQPYQPAKHRTQQSMSPRIPLLFSFLALAYAQSCFWPNGDSQDDTRYRPCSNDTSKPLSHICCAEWHECLPNGLCLSDSGAYRRVSCTLSNWEGGGCQDLCTGAIEQRKDDVQVTPCDNTSTSVWWCCGSSNACCSDTSLAKYQVDNVFLGSISTSSLPSAASSSLQSSTNSPLAISSSSSPSPSPTASASNNDNDALSTGAKAGIGVGAAIGVIALVTLGVFIGRRTHKKKKEDTRVETGYREPDKEALPPVYGHEVPATREPAELVGDQIQPQEVPGNTR